MTAGTDGRRPRIQERRRPAMRGITTSMAVRHHLILVIDGYLRRPTSSRSSRARWTAEERSLAWSLA